MKRSVKEDVAAGQIVLRVTANDNDCGINWQMRGWFVKVLS